MRLQAVVAATAEGPAGTRVTPEAQLGKAAHQFEAMMMKELLAPMARPGDLFSDGDGGQNGILGEFASESLAGALSAGGGLGIADRIVHSLSRSGNPSAAPGIIGKLENNTGLSAGK